MKLSKLSIPYRAVKTSGSLLGILAFTSLETLSFSPAYALAGLVIFVLGFALTGAWFYLVWKNFSFEITEDTFDIQSGVIQKQRREIPLHRIQNADVRRSIFQRILGIAKVNLETAGGKTSEASLMFVDFEQAKSIQARIRRLKQEEDTFEEEQEDTPMFSLSDKELAILSLTSIDLRILSVLFVGLSFLSIGPLIEGMGIGAITVLGLVTFGLLSIAWISSTATSINKYYGFNLYRRGDSLEYERGLLNRSEGSIPLGKIQNLRIEENPLKRWLGYATLKVETAGYSGQGQEQQGAEVAIPLARKDHVETLSNKIFSHGNYSIQNISRNAVRRYFTRYTLAALIPVTGILIASTTFQAGINPLFIVLFIPLIGAASYLKYINKGFYEGEKFFYTRNGFWSRKTTITPYYRIQNLSLSQTIFQERWETSTLILDTAGVYAFSSNPKVVDIDEEVGEKLFERVYNSFKKSSKN